MGQVIGATDAQAAVPISNPYTPQNVLATAYHVLGIEAATTTIPDFAKHDVEPAATSDLLQDFQFPQSHQRRVAGQQFGRVGLAANGRRFFAAGIKVASAAFLASVTRIIRSFMSLGRMAVIRSSRAKCTSRNPSYGH